jgi:hypothetical protein
MIYGDKLRQCLKTEQNPINKMYLNDLLINWEKVEASIEETKDSPITTMVSAISGYTKYLTTPKFKYNVNKKCGFIDDHDVFKIYYLYDIVERLLFEAGIRETIKGLKIKHRPFCKGFQLQYNSFDVHTQKPYLEMSYSGSKYLSVGLEFDYQYRLVDRKVFNKTKIFVPLIIFFIEKHFNEKHFDEIEQLKKDMLILNPTTKLFCITESVDRKLLRNYSEIEEHLFVARCNFKGEPYNDLQPQVFLSLFTKLYNYAHKDLDAFAKVVPSGNIDLINKSGLISMHPPIHKTQVTLDFEEEEEEEGEE